MRQGVGGAVIALSLICASDAPAATISTPQDIARALQKARPDEVLTLAPGVYDDVRINSFHGSATLTSADPQHRAQFHHMTIQDSSGLTLQNIELVSPLADAAQGWRIPFSVQGSSHIVIRNLEVHSVPGSTLATENGGLIIRDSDHVLLADSDFHDLHAAIQHINDNDIVIRGNRLHHLRDDGIRGGGSSNIVIADNHCSTQHYDASDQDHPDCIQFWTSNTSASAHDITVRDNTYDRGDGAPVQGIFFNDEAGHPYVRVTITGNRIHGALWNGIYVHGAQDVRISDNQVCDRPDQKSWITVIDVHGAQLDHNLAGLFQVKDSTEVKQTDDKVGHCKG